jgi:signal transduction histidine kinase/CheY-like chemotaxis protein
MLKQRFKYLVLVIFLGSILLIVFLQYNSGESIKNLIRDNKSLLNELEIKTKLQQMQTDIIFAESALRDLVSTGDAQHIQEIDRDINKIQTEFAEIDSIVRPTSESGWEQLDFLVNEKIENTNQAISTLYNKGKDSALAFIRSLRGRTIRDSIIQTISLINENRQLALSNISKSVNINGVKAKSWGIVLALIACLASIVAFWYLIDQGQRQQKLIQTLDKSEKNLKEASKIQEQFVANISHEIRTPMNAVLGFAGLLQKTSLDKNQHDYVKSIRSSAENLLAIINDILDLSRIESGMMQIESLPFSLRELVDSLRTMLNVKAKNRNLYLRTEIDESVPETLKGDAVRLTQILLNLIGNALKFTHQGGVSVKVESAEQKEETCFIRFIISDTGIGIDPEKQKNIFERFHQAQPETTRRYGGTGLGLSIVKQLVEIQNGKISIDSEPGNGSVFTVVLPYQVAIEEEKPAESNDSVLAAPMPQIKLLVAEDNAMNRKLVRHLLNQWQISFDIVTDGARAVEILKQKPDGYDMVLMDIQMPEMDGYTATEKIRYDLHLNLPIIAMTAHALAGEKEKCLGAGMDDYISKPINEDQLYKLIYKHARSRINNVAPVINMEYLRSLSRGDEDFEKNMIRSFSEQVPADLKALKTAIDHKNYKEIRSITHNMKSTVSYLGLHQVTPLLQQMEIESEKENGITAISDNFISLEATCQLAVSEAEKLISSWISE